MADHPVFDSVRTVMAVREYDDRPVPEELIHRIAESAQLTASSQNGQPWHFVVVRERETLREIGGMVAHGPYIAGAAFAVACSYERSSRFGVSDLSRAIQSMMLTAWEGGVGSNWTGFGGMDEVAGLLGIPSGHELFAVIPFGYPRRTIRGKKRRRPLGEVVSAERFGTPFAG
ncbi:MAG TPA: nitroreductase family protein [Candidatus Dormibacteraeota bacterium]|nr:nitroreductase family protein [Candidatus Dormibacteraeota bacterium]